MELTESPVSPPKNPVHTPNTIPIRIHKSTAKLLRSIIIKCNRKTHGRKVKADDIIAAGIDLLTDEHLDKIKQSTYSSNDQLEIEFKNFCKSNGPVSKDEFLRIILSRALLHGANKSDHKSKIEEES